ncbi:MAG: hypothetical protein ACSLFN_01465 [Candidatus Limnocylindrales bacterium]
MTTPTPPARRVDSVRRRPLSAGAILAVAALLAVGLTPVLAAEASAAAPQAAASASILIVSLDTRGTDSTDDDVLVDGSSFSVRLDDGDRAFDASLDAVADGPTPATGGLLDTALLGPGWYWVDAVAPDGYEAPPPILIELNTDGTRTCVWEGSELSECQANDAGAEGLSWTMVLVRHAPSALPTATPTAAPTSAPTDPTTTPTGAVEGATGRPAVTLPPTDVVGAGREPASTPAAAWVVFLLIAFSTLTAWTAWSSRAAAVRRSGPRLD